MYVFAVPHHGSLWARCTRLTFKWLLATVERVEAKVELWLYEGMMKNFCLQWEGGIFAMAVCPVSQSVLGKNQESLVNIRYLLI